MKSQARWAGPAALLAAAVLAGCVGLSVGSTGFLQLESARIYSIRYEADSRLLTVVLRGGDVYDFRDVPADVYEGWLRAGDKDAYFDEQVRDAFPSTRLAFE